MQTTAVLSGLVPYGLFFLIAVAYTAGAATIAGRGALVQQVNAVESVSNVDVVCTDKTGTLTTGRLTLVDVEPLAGADRGRGRGALGALARSATTPNLTTAALAAACPGPAWTVRDEVPFSSSLRWSRVATGRRHLGARRPGCACPPRCPSRSRPPPSPNAPARGLRVLVLARSADPGAGLRDGEGRPALPALEPVALVALADELRPEVTETISGFRADGVALKVLSGDDPRTVAALAAAGRPRRRRAGRRRRARRPRRPRRWTGSSPAPPSSAASPPSRRNASSIRCAARAATSR